MIDMTIVFATLTILCIGVSLYEIKHDMAITMILGSLLIRISLMASVLLYNKLESREFYAALCCFADPKFLITCIRDIISMVSDQFKQRDTRAAEHKKDNNETG